VKYFDIKLCVAIAAAALFVTCALPCSGMAQSVNSLPDGVVA
jgi:hypothetical protein